MIEDTLMCDYCFLDKEGCVASSCSGIKICGNRIGNMCDDVICSIECDSCTIETTKTWTCILCFSHCCYDCLDEIDWFNRLDKGCITCRSCLMID